MQYIPWNIHIDQSFFVLSPAIMSRSNLKAHGLIIEMGRSSLWWNFNHWLHWKLSKWQLPVQPVMKISSKWHFQFSDVPQEMQFLMAHWPICFRVASWHYGRLTTSTWHGDLTHWGRDKMAAIFRTTFSNAFSWMKINEFWLRFHWNLFPRVQLTIFQYWFR